MTKKLKLRIARPALARDRARNSPPSSTKSAIGASSIAGSGQKAPALPQTEQTGLPGTDPQDNSNGTVGRVNKTVAVFDPREALARLRELNGRSYLAALDDIVAPETSQCAFANQAQTLRENRECWGDEFEFVPLSSEETLRARRLHALLEDKNGGHRQVLVATDGIVKAVEELAKTSPQGRDAISVVADACALSLRASLPVALPPIILAGPPGTGKSFLAARLATALDQPHVTIPVNSGHLFGTLGGLSAAWKGATAGRIAKSLIEHGSASPVFIMDEIDKPVIASLSDRPHDPLLTLWEPENAKSWKDEYYDLSFDTRHLIHIATANDVECLPRPILDRALVVEIPPPTPHAARAIALQIFSFAVERFQGIIDTTPNDEVLDRLCRYAPRRIRRIVQLALPIAVRAEHPAITITDIAAAERLLTGPAAAPRHAFGFVPPTNPAQPP